MSNQEETPGATSSRGFRDIECGDDFSSFSSIFWTDDMASEDDLVASIDIASSRPPQVESTRSDHLKRKAAVSNHHKGVHFKKKNKKFVSRLCVPGGKSRKLELGEYNTHDEAARAYQVGAFYYNKASISNCGEDHTFLETLPCVPDDLSDADKVAWVRERARHSAKHVSESGGNSFDARPGTPASYGTEGSCDDYHPTPTKPTTPRSAYTDVSFWSSRRQEQRAKGSDNMLSKVFNTAVEDQVDFVQEVLEDKLVNRRKGKLGAPHSTSESKRQASVQIQSQGSPNVELQQGRNSNVLTDQAPVADHQGVSQVKFTDSILFALVELRKQGWEWTLKVRSPSSVETGVLFSVPKGQHVAPALCITDIITNSFHELREQGWEVHLQPHEGRTAELISKVCLPTIGCATQDKMKASKFRAWSLKMGSWERLPGYFGVQLMVKFSYAKQKLVWEVRESGHRKKMEILWSEIDTMKATYSNLGFDTLEIHVSRPPSFFKHSTLLSCWIAIPDFTEGQASMCIAHKSRVEYGYYGMLIKDSMMLITYDRLHSEFPLGALKEHYEKLVQCDPRLKTTDVSEPGKLASLADRLSPNPGN